MAKEKTITPKPSPKPSPRTQVAKNNTDEVISDLSEEENSSGTLLNEHLFLSEMQLSISDLVTEPSVDNQPVKNDKKVESEICESDQSSEQDKLVGDNNELVSVVPEKSDVLSLHSPDPDMQSEGKSNSSFKPSNCHQEDISIISTEDSVSTLVPSSDALTDKKLIVEGRSPTPTADISPEITLSENQPEGPLVDKPPSPSVTKVAQSLSVRYAIHYIYIRMCTFEHKNVNVDRLIQNFESCSLMFWLVYMHISKH